MFIITLGDVFWIIFAVACVVIFIICFFVDKAHQNSKYKKPEDKPAKAPEAKKEPIPWYLALLGIIFILGLCLWCANK